jgi:hypothetical protein
MISRERLLQLGLPALVAGILLVAALSLRSSSPSDEPLPMKKKVSLKPAPSTVSPALSRPMSPPGPPEAVIKTADEARLRGTYDNYRTAVALGNRAAQASLEKILRSQPKLAIQFAEEELAGAQDPANREIAMKTLEALRK